MNEKNYSERLCFEISKQTKDWLKLESQFLSTTKTRVNMTDVIRLAIELYIEFREKQV